MGNIPEKNGVIVKYGAGISWEMMEFPNPDPEPGAMITKITMSSICDSDVHTYKGQTQKHGQCPQVIEFMARTIDKYLFDKVISHKIKLEDTEEALKEAAAGRELRAAIVME